MCQIFGQIYSLDMSDLHVVLYNTIEKNSNIQFTSSFLSWLSNSKLACRVFGLGTPP